MLKTNAITINSDVTITGAITFTTTPTMLTQPAGTNSTSAATTAYVDTAITNVRASNNSWSGSNTFSSFTTNGITLGTPTTLPSLALNQMGGMNTTIPALLTTIIETTNTAIATSPVFAPGTYIVRWRLEITPALTTTLISMSVGTSVGIISCGAADTCVPFNAITVVRNGVGFYTTVSTNTTLTLYAASSVTPSTCSSNYDFSWMRIC